MYSPNLAERTKKAIKSKTCVCCKNTFQPYKTTQKVCSPKCAIEFAKAKVAKEEAKSWAKEKKERKEKLKNYSDWLKELQEVFNAYIRERDTGCISCGTQKPNIKYDAGHFFSVGGFPNVRFDEDNVHKQCSKNCNLEKHGNIHEYRLRLIEKIGIERFEALEKRARTSTLKLTIPEIKEKIKLYKEKYKQLKELKDEAIH